MIELSFHKKLISATGTMVLSVNTTIHEGSLVTLYGKSGAGKTTILRILGGLTTPDTGTIKVNNTTWLDTSKKINLKPQKRKVGFVFQDYALFPHMTVKENLAFALVKGQNPTIINHLIEMVELGELQHRKPNTLSGGQQQRVALARALVQKPKLLMLDEPLSALDEEIRYKLQHYILTVHKEFGLTTLLISHDISEVLRMSDIVIELNQGKILRQGTTTEIFQHQNIHAQFQLVGTLLQITKQDFMYILTIQIGKDVVNIVAEETEGKNLNIGDKILVSAKAFNPIIQKIG
jgi:molybdate transport system ATP-binding protein